MKLLLASKSPRRRQLLGELGFPIEFVSINADEHLEKAIDAPAVAEAIAQKKAAAFDMANLQTDEILITADTVVVLGERVLGKPADRTEAIEMLSNLSGRKHTVYTGVCLKTAHTSISFTEATDVYFKVLSQHEIEHYADTYKPLDKAGAYGIQEWIGMIGIERIDGDYYNVMGLPLAHLNSELQKLITQ